MSKNRPKVGEIQKNWKPAFFMASLVLTGRRGIQLAKIKFLAIFFEIGQEVQNSFFVDNNFRIDINDYSIKKMGTLRFFCRNELLLIEIIVPSPIGFQGDRHEPSLD